MGKIVAYHSEITVQKLDGSLVVIKADLDDWYGDREILEILAGPLGARSVGELVGALQKRKGMGNTDPAVLAVRIEGGDGQQLRYMWSDPLG